jgi:hypothetical protein
LSRCVLGAIGDRVGFLSPPAPDPDVFLPVSFETGILFLGAGIA